LIGKLSYDLLKLLSRSGETPRLGNFSWHPDPYSDIEVRPTHPNSLSIHLEKDVREHGKSCLRGTARRYGAHPLVKILTGDREFHLGLDRGISNSYGTSIPDCPQRRATTLDLILKLVVVVGPVDPWNTLLQNTEN
jgi:hypothetical protein